MVENFILGGSARLNDLAQQFAGEYQQNKPFPNIFFEDFFDPAILNQVLAEFPDLSQRNTIHYNNAFEKKFAGRGEQDFGPATRSLMHFLNSEPFLKFLQQLTGIEETLLGDPYYLGGGLHEIKQGGLLKIHVDFNKHPKTQLDRRLNVLVYLNKDWQEEYGGHFELWNDTMEQCVKKISPKFNTLALFSTNHISYHGHPDPLNCPNDMSRKSLALYYYSNGRPKEESIKFKNTHSTIFKERKTDHAEHDAFVKMRRKNALKALVKAIIPENIILKLKPKSKDW